MQRSTWLPRRRRAAFSLIEVVASLLLIGTLLVAVLIAHGRASRQIRAAHRRLEAVQLLDELVAARMTADGGEYQMARGKIPGDNPYHWRSSLRHDANVEALGGSVLRIELFDPTHRDGETVASVELLEPSSEFLLGAPQL